MGYISELLYEFLFVSHCFPCLLILIANKFDESHEKLVERSISVALASKPRQQLYRINIYHTTCKIEVNGRHMYQFLDTINNKRAPALNSIIIVSCLKSILQSCGLEVASISFSAAFLTSNL
jgi:hypothetical protein